MCCGWLMGCFNMQRKGLNLKFGKRNFKSINEEWKKTLVLEDGILALIEKNDFV